MIGVELSVSLFINPAVLRHDDRAMATDLAGVLGRVMPFWYAACLVLLIADAILHRHDPGGLAFASAAILWLLTIVYTLIFLVPINTRIAKDTASSGFDWKTQLVKWDLLHRWRIALLSTALLIFLSGLHQVL